MTFELTNAQREHFGLSPIEPGWEKVDFRGVGFRPDGHLYFDGETIKRWIVSTEDRYTEEQYDEVTERRVLLLPKTTRGRALKLSAAMLEKRPPWGPYLRVDSGGNLILGNHTSQTTFYSTSWDRPSTPEKTTVVSLIERFIADSPASHLSEIARFRMAKRRHVKFKPGDVFSLKLDRTHFGFGRILLDVGTLRKRNLISEHHGLRLGMGHPVIVQLFACSSTTETPPDLRKVPKLPSGLMMDNSLLYGDYTVVGHDELAEEDFEFPISYGRSISALRPGIAFLQWGLIHRELPSRKFAKYLEDREVLLSDEYPDAIGQNPFGFYGIGFSPTYGTLDVHEALTNGGHFDFERRPTCQKRLDLRNPRNASIRREIMEAFDLDPEKGYIENCRSTGTPRTLDVLRQL